MGDFTLAEFEAWCQGEGRGGKRSGKHATALEAIDRFRAFMREKELKRLAREKMAKMAENG